MCGGQDFGGHKKVTQSLMTSPDFERHNTIPKLFWYHVIEHGDDVSIWRKQRGIWEPMTWSEYGQWAQQIGNALIASGIERGETISILSQTRTEWVVCDMAIMGIGCVTAPVYHSNTADQVHYIVDHSDSRFAFVEDQEQLDKMLEIWDRLPTVEKIIVFDKYISNDLPNVISLEKFTASGTKYGENHPLEFEERIKKGKAEETISFIYTSGTTGHPKAGMLHSRNVISVIRHLPDMVGISKRDLSIAYLPLAHIAERLLGHFIKLAYGNQTVFAESIDDLPHNLRQTGPTVMFGTPRVFEKFYARIATGISDATWFQRKVYNWALSIGKEIVEKKAASVRPKPWLRFRGAIARWVICDKVMDIFGGRIRFMISGAAPIAPDIIHYFGWLGIDVYEGYGMTETSGVISANRPKQMKIGSVGQAMPETEIKIAEDGEICVLGAQNITGYYKNEEATNALLQPDENGDLWLHTGDVGHLDEDGFLYITDRKKDILITAGGKNVAPQNIENILKTSPYVSQSMVYGDAKPYLTALITLDEDEITKFARDRKFLYRDQADLSRKQEVIDLIRTEINAKNRDLASYETIKKFRILAEDFDQDNDEITPTFKIRRNVIVSRYKDLLNDMYT
jgi:long-chain acyl-CoA synthetase